MTLSEYPEIVMCDVGIMTNSDIDSKRDYEDWVPRGLSCAILLVAGVSLASCGGGGGGGNSTDSDNRTGTSLAWNAVPGSAGYRIYYGTASGSYNEVLYLGDVAGGTVYGLSSNTVYYFVVTSLDAFDRESQYSSEVVEVVP